jgi:uncharacterized protein YndB with AHSA1/START domain
MSPAAPAKSAPAVPQVVDLDKSRDLVIERVIGAPPATVFLAYSKPEHMLKWFGPPGYPLMACELDFQVGGSFRMAMREEATGEQGPWFGGRFLAIEPDRALVYENGFEGVAETMVVTVHFLNESPGRTRLVMHTRFGTAAMKDEHTRLGFSEGTNAGFDQLNAWATAQVRA